MTGQPFESKTEVITKKIVEDIEELRTFLERSPWNFKHRRYLRKLLGELEEWSQSEKRYTMEVSLLTHEIILRLTLNEDPFLKVAGKEYRRLWISQTDQET